MIDEINETEENSAKEQLKGIAQVIIGEIESLGGIITGDPATSAEGDFNVQVGTLHQESSQALAETENKVPEARTGEADESNQTGTTR